MDISGHIFALYLKISFHKPIYLYERVGANNAHLPRMHLQLGHLWVTSFMLSMHRGMGAQHQHPGRRPPTALL